VERRLFGAQSARKAPTYYELYDLISLQFPRVKMFGQAPFVGYTVADFAPDGDPAVSVDTSLLPSSEEPEHYVAIASERPVVLDPYAVIELPVSALGLSSDEAYSDRAPTIAPGPTLRASLEPRPPTPEEIALTEAQARLTLANAEMESLREKVKDAERRAHEGTLVAARFAELEAELEPLKIRLRQTESRAGDAHVRGERLTHQVRDLEEELARQRDRGTKLSKQLDDERRLKQKAELDLGMLRNKPEIAGAKDRIAELQAELEATKGRLAELELEGAQTLRRRELPALEDEAKRAADDERFAELERALDDAERALQGATDARDEARARVAELVASADRLPILEAELDAAERGRRAALADVRSLEAQLAEREAEVDAALGRAGELEQQLEAELARGTDAAEIAAAAAEEATRLEAQVVERAQVVAQLQRDLREAERIGRDLVSELESASNERDASAGTSQLAARLDSLAAIAAKAQADLEAAKWRITQLERDAADSATRLDPSRAQAELERALAAAHEEIAALRSGATTNGSA
jgi:chromosome segregation ATPase